MPNNSQKSILKYEAWGGKERLKNLVSLTTSIEVRLYLHNLLDSWMYLFSNYVADTKEKKFLF